jgi:hypothetical protein
MSVSIIIILEGVVFSLSGNPHSFTYNKIYNIRMEHSIDYGTSTVE